MFCSLIAATVESCKKSTTLSTWALRARDYKILPDSNPFIWELLFYFLNLYPKIGTILEFRNLMLRRLVLNKLAPLYTTGSKQVLK